MATTRPRSDPTRDVRIDAATKGFPPVDHAVPLSTVADQSWTLTDLSPPVLVLRESALDHNLRRMAEFCRTHDVELMPHGKTTMAPHLWRRHLEAGATGITAATSVQARLMAAVDVATILVANPVTDAPGLRWLADALCEGDLEVMTYVDSEESVALAAAALRGGPRPLPVLVDLGHPGGRGGCRSVDEALALAEVVRATPELAVTGAAGYEGTVCQRRDPECIDAIRRYLAELAHLSAELARRGWIETGTGIVTAGGSLFFDLAVEELTRDRVADRVVLRSGCYLTHDAGHYERLSPFASSEPDRRFRSAIEVWSAVLSRPEPGLAILGMGRRDVSFDLGLPMPFERRTTDGGSHDVGGRVVVEALNDQHAFCRVDPSLPLRPGDLVGSRVSHPCTALDKWRVIPILDDEDHVIEAVATFF